MVHLLWFLQGFWLVASKSDGILLRLFSGHEVQLGLHLAL